MRMDGSILELDYAVQVRSEMILAACFKACNQTPT
jgi:hypothetical protein